MRHTVDNGRFSGRMGAILACVGSAVGMANIWMFPYRLGQNGGAAFLIPYLLFVTLFGSVGLAGEFAIGRITGTGPIGTYDYALKSRGKKGGKALGVVPLIGCVGLAIGYAVIVGWVIRYLFGAVVGTWTASPDPSAYFADISQPWSNTFWHGMVLLLALGVLFIGTKGIEKANKIMMPAFFVLFVALMIRSMLLPGASAGYRYLLVPDWSYLAKPMTWVLAMGQAFFSLSITGGAMIVYGGYMRKEEDVRASSRITALCDTACSLVAAFAIIPAVFAFQMDVASGPSLIFITLPKIFQSMAGGRWIAVFFFLSVVFAGISSLVNMLEVLIEAIQQRLGLHRAWATVAVCAVTFLAGLPIEGQAKLGAWMDLVSIYVLPLGATLGAIVIFWVLGVKPITAECQIGCKRDVGKLFGMVGKYVYVPLVIVVYVLGLVYGGIG